MAQKFIYGVQFTGYLADVLAHHDGKNTKYATLDFVTGWATLFQQASWVSASSAAKLHQFMGSLPRIRGDLKQLLAELASSPDNSICRGPYLAIKTPDEGGAISITVSPEAELSNLSPDVHLNQFIRQAVKRYAEIARVLKAAEKLGATINRRSYAEYIDELAKTGISRVEYHGSATFIHGALRFYPEHRTFLVREHGPFTFQIGE